MKGFYLTIIGVLLGVAIIRFSYGGSPLTLVAFMDILKGFPLDVKEDFAYVIRSADNVVDVFKSFGDFAKTYTGNSIVDEILNAVLSIFSCIYSFMLLIWSIVEFACQVIVDMVELLLQIFRLIFGDVVDTSDSLVPDVGSSVAGGSSNSSWLSAILKSIFFIPW